MVLSCLFLCFKGKKNRGTECNYWDFLRVSYNTLLEATDRFSSAKLIGVGTFGSVYKAVLVTPPDREVSVAVKVFNMLHPGALKSFIAECEVLRNIRHRNIVKIITTCSSIDFRGNDFKALVYEYMSHGSLEKWLHPTTGTQQVTNYLDFVERLKIAIDVACALDYLHNHYDMPIVHCDLKPSNILLDYDLTGRLSDFGLARFLSKPSNISTKQTSVNELIGSVSYIAPEYKMGSEASTYGDVYSFGILLLELFTGKKPSDDMFNNGLNLRNFVETKSFYGVAEIADSSLILQGYSHNKCSAEYKLAIEECLRWIFHIGIVCSSESPIDRIDMSYVVSELQSIRNDFLNWLDGISQTVGVRSRLCKSCIVCRPRMNKQTAWSWSNRCYRQFFASRILSSLYELVDNGSLEVWLHPSTGTKDVRNVTKNLSLVERLDIAIDVAYALDYLHNHCDTPIVYCNLKPSNILLDDELTGRVSDFGVARFLSKPNNISDLSAIELSGSVSYIAPEYKMGSEASTHGDVYSFGILLLELFTGKKPSDDMFSDGLDLRNFVAMNFSYGVAEIADSRLLLQGDNDNPPSKCSEKFKWAIEGCLRLIFNIGFVCSSESPTDRIDMSYVVSELQFIREDFLIRLHSYSQTDGVRSRSCCSCMVCRRRANKQTA